jgi:hypothetical protein
VRRIPNGLSQSPASARSGKYAVKQPIEGHYVHDTTADEAERAAIGTDLELNPDAANANVETATGFEPLAAFMVSIAFPLLVLFPVHYDVPRVRASHPLVANVDAGQV